MIKRNLCCKSTDIPFNFEDKRGSTWEEFALSNSPLIDICLVFLDPVCHLAIPLCFLISATRKLSWVSNLHVIWISISLWLPKLFTEIGLFFAFSVIFFIFEEYYSNFLYIFFLWTKKIKFLSSIILLL